MCKKFLRVWYRVCEDYWTCDVDREGLCDEYPCDPENCPFGEGIEIDIPSKDEGAD